MLSQGGERLLLPHESRELSVWPVFMCVLRRVRREGEGRVNVHAECLMEVSIRQLLSLTLTNSV